MQTIGRKKNDPKILASQNLETNISYFLFEVKESKGTSVLRLHGQKINMSCCYFLNQ